MIRKLVVKTINILIIASLLIVGSCSKKSRLPILSYSSDLNDLRNQFNREKSKVRLLLILSPT